MATTGCIWLKVSEMASIPPTFITGGNQLNKAALMPVNDAVAQGYINIGDLSKTAVAFQEEFSSDPDDAQKLLETSDAYYGTYEGTKYIILSTDAGIYIYRQRCGAAAALPYIALGAGLLGIGGFAWGWSRKRGGKKGGGKKGVPAYALMGATVGVLAGAAGGYLLSRLLTNPVAKALDTEPASVGLLNVQKRFGLLNVQKRLGLLDVRMGATRSMRHRCPPGMFWSDWAGRCVRPM